MLSNVVDEESADETHVLEAKEGDYECVVHTYLSIYRILSSLIFSHLLFSYLILVQSNLILI